MFFALCFPIISNATAVTGFNAGRIIDDAVFTNSNSMSVNQIQVFLNSKVPDCDTNGTHPASDFGRSDLTHAQYAATRGWPGPPYPCLKDYNENGVGTAQIIYNVAQQYQINPQVLIVLLQKEQGLVTDTWPLPVQYRSATGYACGDTSACETAYYGLTRQLYWAGTMFHTIEINSQNWSNPYRSGTSWYTPYILGNNYVQYSPNAACGGSTVNIQNRATQALYNYTPYQPNQASLDAVYGTGDSCSSHGNRNFYLYFSDWFGSTIAPDFSAQPVWQQIYTDETKTTSLGWNGNLTVNQTAYAVVVMKNTGNTTWTKNGAFSITDTRLASYSNGGNSLFCNPSWALPCNRPAGLKEDTVAPGAYGTFEFTIKAPSKSGTYVEIFAPIIDGRTEFTNSSKMAFSIIIFN